MAPGIQDANLTSATFAQSKGSPASLDVLHGVCTRVAMADNQGDVLGHLLDAVDHLANYASAVVYLTSVGGEATTGPISPGPLTPTLLRVAAGRSAATGVTHLGIGSAAEADGIAFEAAQSRRRMARFTPAGAVELGVPLMSGTHSLGALEIRAPQPLAEAAVHALEIVAAVAATSLRAAELYEQTQHLAIVDSITGTSNRRHFFDQLEREAERARRMSYLLGLVMLDLDGFTRVNAVHGPAVGDRLLRGVGDGLRRSLRRTDLVGRIGPDEFGLILPGTPEGDLPVLIERIQSTMGNVSISDWGGVARSAGVTFSTGGAAFDPRRQDSGTLVRRAEMALAKAKTTGNHVVLWDESIGVEEGAASPDDNPVTLGD